MDTTNIDADATRPSSPGIGSSPGAIVPLHSQFKPGDIIADRYQIISVLGRGGFGCVYKVNQLLLKKEFALKTLNPINTSEITTLRLQKEAQAAGRLEHPNLVRALDFGMIDGSQPYLVMDLVEGPTLGQFLRQNGKAPVSTALQLFLPLCNALAYAHQQGVIHRDLKPSNVILAADDSGAAKFIPKIVDFGIAKLQSSEASRAMTLTATGDIFGTPLYMSPEQCMGTGVDGRSDIYALGCMLFETLTGTPPFSGNNPLEIMMQHGAATVPSLKEASLGETFPPALERVILRMLAKEPKDRYQNCADVAKDLAAIERGEFAKVTDSPSTLTLRQQHRKQISSSVLLTIMGIVFGATIGYAAHQCLAPPPAVQPKAEVAKETDDGAGLLGLDTGFKYYSDGAGDKRVFHFPPAHKHSLGDIYWWQDGKLQSVPATQNRELPMNARLIFKIESDMLVAPDLWPRFHPSEFQGIIVDLHSCYIDEDPLNQSIREITQQQDLRLLDIAQKVISSKTFSTIGALQQLRWLDMRRITVDFGDLKGEAIAQLPNLQNLHLLRLERVNNITPALVQLAKKSSLRRLSLPCTKLTPKDIALIGQIKSLEVLSVQHNDLGKADVDVIAQVAKMPNLKTVVLDSGLLAMSKPQTISALSGTTIITDDGKLPPPLFQAAANNHSIKLIQDKALRDCDGNYFNALTQDPAPML